MFEVKKLTGEIVSRIRGLLTIGKKDVPLPSMPGIDRKPPESYFSLSEGQANLSRFPARYRECFDPEEPIGEESLFVGRDGEVGALKNALELWRGGNPCSVAVIGHSGCGKTSLFDFFQKNAGGDISVEKIALRRRLTTTRDVLVFFKKALELESNPSTVQDLAAAINDLPGRVILLENFHLAFLRAQSCHEALRAFLYLIMSTSRSWLWVVSIDYYSWLKMEYLYRVSTYFTCDVTISHLEKPLFREVFLTRQEASGYRLSSDAADEAPVKDSEHVEPAALDPDARHAAFMETYFDTLHGLSGGNIQAALVYWLSSIYYDEENEAVAIRAIEKPDFAFLAQMEQLHIFSLAEIVNHGGLSAREHGLIFGTGEFESLLVLEFLHSKKVIERERESGSGADARYRLNPFFSMPVVSMLKEKNILY